jgi:hypothetical protein
MGTHGVVRTPTTRGGYAAPTRRLVCPSIAIKAKLRCFVRESLMRLSRHSMPRISLCLACPEHPLCSGDGLVAPDTVLDRAGRKGHLGHAAGNDFLSGAPQISLGTRLTSTA